MAAQMQSRHVTPRTRLAELFTSAEKEKRNPSDEPNGYLGDIYIYDRAIGSLQEIDACPASIRG